MAILFILLTSFTFLSLNPLQLNGLERNYLNNLRKIIQAKYNSNFWYELDPGPGGSGGYPPSSDMYFQQLLSFNPYPEAGTIQTENTEGYYSAGSWVVSQKSATTKENFLDSFIDMNNHTNHRFCVSYVGHEFFWVQLGT